MSFFNPPKPPDPYQSSQTQLGFNKQAAQASMFGQETPTGSLTWKADPNAPGGYSAIQALTPAQQELLQLRQVGQTGVGQAAAGLGGDIAGMYGQPPALDTSSLTNQLMDWQTQSMQPYWDIQKSNLQSQLQSQGLNPNDTAWQNAMMAFTKGIGQARNEMFAQAEPLAFGQAVQKYQLPLQTEASLFGMSAPAGVGQFAPTPQIQSPNYQQAAQNQYQAQQNQYQNMMQGIGQLGGMAMAPFTGGMSLFGTLPFAGGWSSGSFGGTGGGLGGQY